MSYEFKLPDIGEGVVEGEIVKWLVKEGDPIKEDQPMVEVMTDKATVEIPSPKAGRVARRFFKEGDKCPVGKVLIAIDLDGAAGAPVGAAAAAAKGGVPGLMRNETTEKTERIWTAGGEGAAPAQALAATPAPVSTGGIAAPANGQTGRGVLATPAVRKLARERGIDIRMVRATGPGGRVTRADLEAFSGSAPARQGTAPAPGIPSGAAHPPVAVAPAAGDVRVPFRGLRKLIAERMTRSVHTAAHFTYVEEIDCTDLVALRERANERLKERGVKLSFLPFIIKAVCHGLQKFPQLNATLDEAAGEIVQRRVYHIGIAAATKDGLIVPVVHDADKRSLVGIAQEIDRLAAATKAGKATREELGGSTFTITSLGAAGGVLATPIINFPEVAILGVHKIAKKPAFRDGEIVVRDLMNLSISVDHRLTDGYDASMFMQDVKQSLEAPGLLYLDSV